MKEPLLPESITVALATVGYKGLRYDRMAAHLLVHCVDPSEFKVHESHDDKTNEFWKHFLPYDPETKEFFHIDPLFELYKRGKTHFSQEGVDPKKFLQEEPLTKEEKDCLEKLLGDDRIPFVRLQLYAKLVKKEFPEATEEDFIKD